MSAELESLDARTGAAEVIEVIERDGGVIVENFLPPDLLDRLLTELEPVADGFGPGMDGGSIKQAFCGEQTKRFSGLITRAPSFAEVVDLDLLHRWAEHSFVGDYWLNTGQAIIIGPGSEAQYLHRDAGNWPVMLAQGADAPEATISVMLALSDFTEANGATRVVPGSHRWDDFATMPDPDQTVGAVMPAGSALLYSGKTIHGGGANVSDDQWRFGIQLSFTLAQLTPEEAHTVTTPWEVAKELPDRVQHMLGYFSHRTFLPGWPVLWTADYRDVRDTLDPPQSGDYLSAGARLVAPAASSG